MRMPRFKPTTVPVWDSHTGVQTLTGSHDSPVLLIKTPELAPSSSPGEGIQGVRVVAVVVVVVDVDVDVVALKAVVVVVAVVAVVAVVVVVFALPPQQIEWQEHLTHPGPGSSPHPHQR